MAAGQRIQGALHQLTVPLNFNSIDKKMVHASWLIGGQSFAASGKVGDSPNRSGRNRRRVKNDNVSNGSHAQHSTISKTKQIGLHLCQFMNRLF